MSEFHDIYTKLQKIVIDHAEAKKPEFDDPLVADQDATHLEKAKLLKIESDDDFVRNCFYKILGRTVRSRDVRHYSRQLSKSLTREELIEKLMNSPEYKSKEINVRLV